MTQEISEISVEINEIFNNMSIDLLNKIPLNVRDFFKNNASNTYTFEYDTTKSLNEQNIKNKTRGIIALLYRDYICDDEERKEYNDIYAEFLSKKSQTISSLYNTDDMFKKSVNISCEDTANTDKENYPKVITDNQNFFKKLFNKISSFFKK